MSHILLVTLALVVLSGTTWAQTPAQHKHKVHLAKMEPRRTNGEMAKECEERMTKVKEAGTSLPAPWKTEFEYNLKIVGIECEVLKDPTVMDTKKHMVSCHNHLNAAEHIIRRYDRQVAHEKRMEERKAEAEKRKAREEERRAKAEERRAKAAERKAMREAAKAKRAAAKAERETINHNKMLAKNSSHDNLDHGTLEGAGKSVPDSGSKGSLE